MLFFVGEWESKDRIVKGNMVLLRKRIVEIVFFGFYLNFDFFML